MASFDGTDDYFDSREVIERIAELEAEYADVHNRDFDPKSFTISDLIFAMGDAGAEEFQALLALREEAEGYISDWQYGETFYTWGALVEYAEETVRECYTPGGLPSWVTNHIDWEAVAEEIKVDYTEFEFRGTTYYAR